MEQKKNGHNLFLEFKPKNNTFGFAQTSIYPKARKYSISSEFCEIPRKICVNYFWHLGDDSQRSRTSQLKVGTCSIFLVKR